MQIVFVTGVQTATFLHTVTGSHTVSHVVTGLQTVRVRGQGQ